MLQNPSGHNISRLNNFTITLSISPTPCSNSSASPDSSIYGMCLTILLFDQALVDVANVGEEVTDGCDLRKRTH